MLNYIQSSAEKILVRHSNSYLRYFFGFLLLSSFIASLTSCEGSAEDLYSSDYLGDPTIDDGGSRTDGSDQGQIYTVTKIVEATNEIVEWDVANLPFTGPRRSLGVSATDSQWPFQFLYTYPANNYAIGDARLLIATSRDSSDTEGIFIDGVLTGRIPAGHPSPSSPQILYRNYSCSGCTGGAIPTGTANHFYMDWALSHYKIGAVNTFDLSITNLLTYTPLALDSILDDGLLRVVSGDDAVIQTDTATVSRPLLIMEGFTISRNPLTCTQSSVYKLANNYVHNDGNSISSDAFSGTVLSPVNSWATPYAGIRSVEFFYDPKLPKLSSYTNLNITKAEILMQVRRTTADPTALVINGIGIDQDGFDRTPATSAIESWSADAVERTYWNNFVNAIPANNSQNTVTLNLLSLLGATKVKELLLQGKLNLAIAGPLANVYGQNNTSARTYGVSVNGPELILEGNYSAEICEIPDNPDSPLNGGSGVPSDCLTDTTSPVVSSVQVSNITSTSARVQWLTNEGSSTQVGYGPVTPSTTTAVNPALTTFHSVDITGLQPYKYYQYNVRSTDACGNYVNSATRSFRTLR